MLIKSIIFLILVAFTTMAPINDLMTKIPGYPADYPTKIYSGYLDTSSVNRSLHYVFVQSVKGTNNSDPVILWLNGGPGCSSMLGFLQQIGPYYLEEGIDYKQGDNLTKNQYSWHNIGNLLFLQSPADVGYSVNLQPNFEYNDAITASDSFFAVRDFFSKFPEYSRNNFWITGQSYAGKYIPDLAVLIDKWNLISVSKIQFKGIVVGNGVMSFENGQLQYSTIDFILNHEFIDPELKVYWKTSCFLDPESAGCGYFINRFEENIEQLNPYSIYDYCYYNDSFAGPKAPRKNYYSQQTMLKKRLHDQRAKQGLRQYPKFNGAPCAYFDGVFDYFNLNDIPYHAKIIPSIWKGPCNENITYNIDLRGSMASYRYLMSRFGDIQIVLYNGDWDAVVPYLDTLKNLQKLNLEQNFVYTPWFTNGQHSGFTQLYSGILFATFKGASHQVPQSKRAESLDFIKAVFAGHKFFNKTRQI